MRGRFATIMIKRLDEPDTKKNTQRGRVMKREWGILITVVAVAALAVLGMGNRVACAQATGGYYDDGYQNTVNKSEPTSDGAYADEESSDLERGYRRSHHRTHHFTHRRHHRSHHFAHRRHHRHHHFSRRHHRYYPWYVVVDPQPVVINTDPVVDDSDPVVDDSEPEAEQRGMQPKIFAQDSHGQYGRHTATNDR